MIKLIIVFFVFSLNSFSASISSPDLQTGRNIRDPFKVIYKKKMGHKRARREKFTGFSNRTTTDHLRIDRLRVTGIFLGKSPRALVKEVDGDKLSEAIIIKEGMKIGPDSVEVKAILPGGVVLVEKIINVYDEEEYLETILPLSE